jgi:phosphopantothenoylcysteine decarboxylase/phosphopantothenate--cysteine ligase
MPSHPGRLLITAGPTHEPIDDVRFIGNRSSGRLGVALAEEADLRGWAVTLLLGPVALRPERPRVAVRPFRSTADLQALLAEEFPRCDTLVMAAAVADFRPRGGPGAGKIRRGDAGLTLELESTPDLLAGCAASKRPGQLVIGFALEPADRLLQSARDKARRKGADAIVANPLETMDSDRIDATLVTAEGPAATTGGPIAKAAFAGWLLDRLGALRDTKKPTA